MIYEKARVRHARLTTWGEKYNALVDDVEATVEGVVFWVKCKDWEDRLRAYETDHYEVVRCEMEIEGALMYGLTFRFTGAMEFPENEIMNRYYYTKPIPWGQ